MPTVSTTCTNCGKPFSTYRSPAYLEKTKDLYCSRACYLNKQATAQSFICAECGLPFLARISPARSNPRFCSRKCHVKHVDSMVDFVCQECGKVFRRNQSLKRKYCSKPCAGKHSYIVQRNPTPIDNHCRQCGRLIGVQKRMYQTWFCRRKCYELFCATLTPEQIVEGVAAAIPLNMPAGYRGPDWDRQRKKARQRDSYRCQRCGVSEQGVGRDLDVHHIKPFQEFGIMNYKAANVLTNLISLCASCHTHVEAVGWAHEQASLF